MTKKSTEYRLGELGDAINLITFSYMHYMETGNPMFLIAIKSQLRALIATGGRNMKPLLFELSEKLNIPLYIYSTLKSPPPPAGSRIVSDMPVPKSWSTVPGGGYEQFLFKDWMQYVDYLGSPESEYVNRNKMLREIADTSAAHYDDEIRYLMEEIDRMLASPLTNSKGEAIPTSGVVLFILDLALATRWLGWKLLLIANGRESEIENLDNSYRKQLISETGIARMVMMGPIELEQE